MPDKATFMEEMYRDLNVEEKVEQDISPPTLSMRNDRDRPDLQIPKKQKPKYRRTSSTPWKGSARR
jgi:hypothetical protein